MVIWADPAKSDLRAIHDFILVKYTPQLAAGNQWLGFQRGAAALWSRAG